MGRPTFLTPELQAGIVADLSAGCTLDIAAACNGICDATLQLWLKKGREGNPRYVGFFDAVQRARADLKKRLIGEIRAGLMPGGKGGQPIADAKWRAWLLERLDPHNFGDQKIVHVKVEKELERILDKLEKRLPQEIFEQVAEVLLEDVAGEVVEAAVDEAVDDEVDETEVAAPSDAEAPTEVP